MRPRVSWSGVPTVGTSSGRDDPRAATPEPTGSLGWPGSASCQESGLSAECSLIIIDLPHEHRHSHVDVTPEIEPFSGIDVVEDVPGWSLIRTGLSSTAEDGGNSYEIYQEHVKYLQLISVTINPKLETVEIRFQEIPDITGSSGIVINLFEISHRGSDALSFEHF